MARVEVIQDISANDEMFQGNRTGYFKTAASCLRCVELAMQAAGMERPTSILDLPCGHGRVLRMLKARFPEAQLTACDTNRDGVEFCARTFDAAPVYASDEPSSTRIEGSFDLVWVGSLLTHFDKDRWRGFMDLFMSVLAPGASWSSQPTEGAWRP